MRFCHQVVNVALSIAGDISTGNVVKVFKNALCTALRTIFRPKNAPHCRILHYTNLTIFIPEVLRLELHAEATPVLGLRHQFPPGSPAFPLFLFLRNDHWSKGQLCPEAELVTVGLASHWPCITDLVGGSTCGLKSYMTWR